MVFCQYVRIADSSRGPFQIPPRPVSQISRHQTAESSQSANFKARTFPINLMTETMIGEEKRGRFYPHLLLCARAAKVVLFLFPAHAPRLKLQEWPRALFSLPRKIQLSICYLWERDRIHWVVPCTWARVEKKYPFGTVGLICHRIWGGPQQLARFRYRVQFVYVGQNDLKLTELVIW